MILPSSLAPLSWNGTRVGPTAAVERAHSDRARSGSKGSARLSFHPFHRARSASKKGTWPLPSDLLCSHRPTPPNDLSPSIATSRAHEAICLHLLDHPSRPRIAHPQPALNQRCRSLTCRQDQLFGLLVYFAQRLFLFRPFLFQRYLQLLIVGGAGLILHELDHAADVVIRHKRPVQPHDTSGPRSQIEHVPTTKERFRAVRIQDGA